MKSKALKRAEAIERNSKYRQKYIDEARDLNLKDGAVEAYADRKQGIPKKKSSY